MKMDLIKIKAYLKAKKIYKDIKNMLENELDYEKLLANMENRQDKTEKITVHNNYSKTKDDQINKQIIDYIYELALKDGYKLNHNEDKSALYLSLKRK